LLSREKVRLTQIKLSGFKSFVDPTVIPTPSQLVGVVGPNGCGKSNIIDAVRWVLGETRATELRGESMQDVILADRLIANRPGALPLNWSLTIAMAVRRANGVPLAKSQYVECSPGMAPAATWLITSRCGAVMCTIFF